ncbi:hypothetical protein [Amycolatopsis magusensis]|uniref:hypothetical protein n=1 Tax=Amycolatopsis magusensis TaxID=882444 RepID=UPI003C2FBD20
MANVVIGVLGLVVGVGSAAVAPRFPRRWPRALAGLLAIAGFSAATQFLLAGLVPAEVLGPVILGAIVLGLAVATVLGIRKSGKDR